MVDVSVSRASASRTTSTWVKRWWQPLRRQPSALAGLSIVGTYIVLAVFAPLFATHDPILQDFAVALQPPSLSLIHI